MNFADEKTSGAEGAQLFGDLRELAPDMPIILLTAWTNLEMAVELVKAGAADYLGKPWDDDRLITTVRNLVELKAARERSAALENGACPRPRAMLADEYDLCGTVYVSDAMHEVVSLACRVAASDINVLITGPNGSGKEKTRRDRSGQLPGSRRSVCPGQCRRLTRRAAGGGTVRC